MTAVSLILGDQLFSDISSLPAGPIVMVEDPSLARRCRYHSHKLVLTFASMRAFAQKHGSRVIYSRLEEGRRVQDAVKRALDANSSSELHTYEPADAFFAEELRDWAKQQRITLIEQVNPMFLTSARDWQAYQSRHRRSLMADFYKLQRRRLGILVDPDGTPEGGKWSFDEFNRKPLPKGLKPPSVPLHSLSQTTHEVIEMVSKEFPLAAGDPQEFWAPVTHEEAELWLSDFVANRLDRFGDFEDAISSVEVTLYHSLLTPLLNTGLLTPLQVITAVLEEGRRRLVPLNSLEGFIRQVIGWREFVRGVSREPHQVTNPFGHSRKLGESWRSGTTGLPPLDSSLQRAARWGWCHHIERLMVVGSAMFMCEVEPIEVEQYFMEMFIDAAEWVMGPNVHGMSQSSWEDSFATKPYISGSAYLRKMSDFAPGPWCDVWDGLYWRTIERNFNYFARNQRTTQAAASLHRLSPERKERILSAADRFIQLNTC